ncbi:hypothetical protein JCM8547_000840 [Rhodosporidiobolus lusitaniae]
MTDSGTSSKSSPTSTVPFVSPRETPPPNYRSNHSNSPSAALSPLPPLPIELFFSVLHFLPQDDIERLLYVSRSWYNCIAGEPSLWHTLSAELNRDDQARIDLFCRRANVNGSGKRSHGGIKTLRLSLRSLWTGTSYGDIVSDKYAVQRMNEIFEAVHEASVPHNAFDRQPHEAAQHRAPTSSLRTLFVNLAPNTLASAVVLHHLAKWARISVCFDLEHLRIHAALPGFKLDNRVLRMWPRLVTLDLQFNWNRGRYAKRVDVDPWSWQPDVQPSRTEEWFSLDRLEILKIANAEIADFEIPYLPSLKHLSLEDVGWEGRAFFFFLRLARKTLETLYCSNFRFDPVEDEYEDWSHWVDIREPDLVDGHLFSTSDGDQQMDDLLPEPAPIILPKLRQLTLSDQTVPLFASLEAFELNPDESDPLATPILVMPVLDEVLLDEIPLEPEYGQFDESYNPLVSLGRSAPQLHKLRIHRILVADVPLHCCLAALSVSLTDLDLFETLVTDHFIVRLPEIAPLLKRLNVVGSTEITCQGVARAVEVMRVRHDEGESKIEQVWVDPPAGNSDPACRRAYAWLDFVGVLQRDEDDFEGLGPVGNPGKMAKWVKEGKKDAMWLLKEKLAELEEKARKEREKQAKLAAEAAANRPGRAGPLMPFHLSAFNAISTVQSQLASLPFTPAQQHAQFPPGLNIPAFPLAPTPTPSLPPSSVNPNTITLPPPIPAAAHAWAAPPPAGSRLPPNRPPPPTPPRRPAATDGFDISTLDDSISFEDLDPALVAEQQLAFQQAQQRTQAGYNTQVNAQKQQEQQQQRAIAQHQQHLYRQQQYPPAVAPHTAADFAHVEGLRRAHAGHTPAHPTLQYSGDADEDQLLFRCESTVPETPMGMTPRPPTPVTEVHLEPVGPRGMNEEEDETVEEVVLMASAEEEEWEEMDGFLQPDEGDEESEALQH